MKALSSSQNGSVGGMPKQSRISGEPATEMFYKKGVTDPDYCVLRFTAFKGGIIRLKTESFLF
jgi:hypothetical protein